MKTFRLESFAKVNLRLEILKKREDGYHEIRTVFQKISLHDTIHFSLKKGEGISLTTNQPGLPVGESNLVYKAAQSVLSCSDYRGGISIYIDKRIPLGAGLGGGSSNAATTLMALNRVMKTEFSQREMMSMGVQIGADVPFFFLEKGAIATGIGERLQEVELPSLWYVLIYPNFEVSTHWAYRNSRLTKKNFRYKIQEFLTTPEKISKMLMNDLEDVVSKEFPQIDLMKKVLFSAGALGSLMTGSGPTVFGIFSDKGGASRAYKKVKHQTRDKGWTVLKAHSLP
jgi:4-diphosphocytidyl-2-C-methyl-D-erythritol kinase